MTERQSELMGFIRRHMAAHGMAPNYVEMMGAMGVASRNSISNWLNALERGGHIRRSYGSARGIQITGVCPCCGRKS